MGTGSCGDALSRPASALPVGVPGSGEDGGATGGEGDIPTDALRLSACAASDVRLDFEAAARAATGFRARAVLTSLPRPTPFLLLALALALLGRLVRFFTLTMTPQRYRQAAPDVNRNTLNSRVLAPNIAGLKGSGAMKITLSTESPSDLKVDFLALAVHDDTLAEEAAVQELDRALGGVLRRAINDERFRGRAGQSVVVHTHGRIAPTRLGLFGAGPRGTLRPADFRPLAGRVARAAIATGAASVGLVARSTAATEAAEALACGLLLGRYRFTKYLSEDKRPPDTLQTATLIVQGPTRAADAALARARITAAAVSRARDLINEPAAAMTPTRMAAVAHEIASENGLILTVLGPDECRARGMGMFLAVSQGSEEEPRFIHLAYKPEGARRRIVLVGKGVTFDSGGLSLKPNDSMLDMKVGMSGAAAVISAIGAVAAEKLPVEVHALAACTENMPSGRAYKLGDVLKSMAGKTVEINNTDAEGRLTLGDAITYGLELKPDAVFDFATLTGACVVALGPFMAGVMSNDDTLAGAWLEAAQAAGEDMWRLPLPDRLMDQLKSDIADMKNTGERWGGALTAGLFLKEFVGTTPWVHTDIAGPASADKEYGHIPKGGTGFAVATILEYLRKVAA